MKIREKLIGKGFKKRSSGSTAICLSPSEMWDEICADRYTPLDRNPEIVAACTRIADLISSMTIYLMSNTDKGDKRIINELSRKVDIEPNKYMSRRHWMSAIIMNLLLYGDGNSIVLPHTRNGLLTDLEPIASSRVSFLEEGYMKYKVLIDGKAHNPENLLHFVINPDKNYLWKGQGYRIALREVVDILAQAKATEKEFMSSKFMPSLVVKVDALTDEFSSPDGRQRLVDEYIKTNRRGDPWMIPAEQFDVQQIHPLTLSDLAINDTVALDKRTVASIIGIPPFMLGVGEYNRDAHNAFISDTILPICKEIEQVMTRGLLVSPKWYFKMNVFSLMDYDLNTLADVYGKFADRGYVSGNEARDKINLDPREGLDELRVLENYIPFEKSGDQKKLVQ